MTNPLAKQEQEWRAELLRTLGGDVADELTPIVEGVVQSRAMLIYLAMLVEGAEQPDAPIFRRTTSQCVVRMARWLRLLGLTRRDVRRLDLGRRREAALH